MSAWLQEYWPIPLLFAIVMAVFGGVAYDISTRPAPVCITHVPDPEQWADRQCEFGAHVEPVNGVALCVCPSASEVVK